MLTSGRGVAADELPPYAVLERLDELITRSGTDRPATCLLGTGRRRVAGPRS
ncbi:hypothetical protein [Streptomyces phaeochromogenes]